MINPIFQLLICIDKIAPFFIRLTLINETEEDMSSSPTIILNGRYLFYNYDLTYTEYHVLGDKASEVRSKRKITVIVQPCGLVSCF